MRCIVSAVLLAAVLSCGSKGSEEDGAVSIAEMDGTTPVSAPVIKDFRVEIEAAFVVTFDLDLKNDEYTLSGPAKAMVSVLVEDETFQPEELLVEAVDGLQEAGAPALPALAEFEDGVWQLEVAVAPDMELRVRASNSAGGVTVSKYALMLPGLETAIAALWESREFDSKGEMIASWPTQWRDDATWVDERPEGDVWGAYQVVGPTLTFWQLDGPDSDGDAGSVDWKRQCDHYVDGDYFVQCPFERKTGADGLVGQWVRVVTDFTPESGFKDQHSWSETLTFTGEGTWFRDFVGKPEGDSGTYESVFLQEPVDGEELIAMHDEAAGTTGMELVVIRSGKLLLSPLRRW